MHVHSNRRVLAGRRVVADGMLLSRVRMESSSKGQAPRGIDSVRQDDAGRSVNTRGEPGKLVLLAVVVIYRQKITESTSFRSLQKAALERPELNDCLKLLVYDNSPCAQAVPP